MIRQCRSQGRAAEHNRSARDVVARVLTKASAELARANVLAPHTAGHNAVRGGLGTSLGAGGTGGEAFDR